MPEDGLVDFDADAGLFSAAEMRGELERLRTELAPAEPAAAAVSAGPCALPAGVPHLPPGLHVSREMEQLATALLSTDPSVRVGFVGMGGIGKTTISAWLVRRDDIRRRFDTICWLPLGPAPRSRGRASGGPNSRPLLQF